MEYGTAESVPGVVIVALELPIFWAMNSMALSVQCFRLSGPFIEVPYYMVSRSIPEPKVSFIIMLQSTISDLVHVLGPGSGL